MNISGGFLPKTIREKCEQHTLTYRNHGQQLSIEVPLLTETLLAEVYEKVKIGESKLKNRRVDELVEVIDMAVQKWLDPTYEKRVLAEKYLPIITGYDHEMIHVFLANYLRNFRREKLIKMIDESFANPAVLDGFRPKRSGGLTRAFGPSVTTHIFSGNVPALPLWSLMSSVLVKSGTVGKVSSSEPLFASLFAETIAEIDPELGQAIAIVWWRGGNHTIEETAFQSSDALIAYGHEQTITSIQKRLPSHVVFLPHGHKVSFGFIGHETLTPALARNVAKRAAKDASWFDQQGCLSPHVFFVEENGSISPRDFARMLANEMEQFNVKMPRRVLDSEEENALIQERSAIEFQVFSNEAIELHQSSQETNWTVVYHEEELFPLSRLNRFVYVVPIGNESELINRTAPMKRFVQTAGIACSPQRFHAISNTLAKCAVNRICFLGEMFQPEAGWHHDGRLHLGDLVRWCDVESSVENTVDEFDPFRV